MNLDANADTILYDHLTRFLSYVRPQGDDSDILYVSVQFLADNRDNELAEVAGVLRQEACRRGVNSLAQRAG
jgi:hypothetical protein